MPTMEDRARQAIHLQALQPIAATTADPNAYGFRPKRRCADAIAQCCNIVHQSTAATGILEGDIAGLFEHMVFPWLEQHIPMPQRLLSTWLRSGFRIVAPSLRPRQECPKAASLRPSSVIWCSTALKTSGTGGTGIAGCPRSTTCDGLMARRYRRETDRVKVP